MKVERPSFNSPYDGEVNCNECPPEGMGKCSEWMKGHVFSEQEPGSCPTAKTYDEAIVFADNAAKESDPK